MLGTLSATSNHVPFHLRVSVNWRIFSVNTDANEHGLGPGQLPGSKVAYQVVGLIRPPPSCSVSFRLQTLEIHQHNREVGIGTKFWTPSVGRTRLRLLSLMTCCVVVATKRKRRCVCVCVCVCGRARARVWLRDAQTVQKCTSHPNILGARLLITRFFGEGLSLFGSTIKKLVARDMCTFGAVGLRNGVQNNVKNLLVCCSFRVFVSFFPRHATVLPLMHRGLRTDA